MNFCKRFIPAWFMVMLVFSVAVVTFGMFGSTSNGTSSEAEALDTNITLTDYAWLDKIPEDIHDNYQVYVFPSNKGNFGTHVFAASLYKFTLEIFEFTADTDKHAIQFHFPHDNRSPLTKYEISGLEKASPIFTAKLVMKKDPQNGGKEKVYYTGPELRIDKNRSFQPEAISAIINNHLENR